MTVNEQKFPILVPNRHHHQSSEQHGQVLVWSMTCLAPLERAEFEHVKAMAELWLRSLERQIVEDAPMNRTVDPGCEFPADYA